MKHIIAILSALVLTSCTSNLYLPQIGTDKLFSTLVNYNKSKINKVDSLSTLEYGNTNNIRRPHQ